MEAMVNTIAEELIRRKGELEEYSVETIYFGGGTPSVIPTKQLKLLLDCVQDNYKLASKLECTLEANPDDCSRDALRDWKSLGINRLSIGVQSFNQHDLEWMNRSHNSTQALEALQNAEEIGFMDINMDLIYGVPSMPSEVWIENVKTAFELPINHISAYSLTVEQGTALHHFIKTRKYPNLDDDKAVREFDYLLNQMELNGWTQYEISNYCKDDNYAVHNTNYWKQQPYLGVGPSAHSYDGLNRRWNVANNQHYIKKVSANDVFWAEEKLSNTDRINEAIMLGLRTQWGVDVATLKSQTGFSLLQEMKQELDEFTAQGLISKTDSVVKLTRKGKDYADQIASDLFITED